MALTPEEESAFREMLSSYNNGKSISQMGASSALVGTELVEVVQGGVSKKAIVNDIVELIDKGYEFGFGGNKVVNKAINAEIATSDFNGNIIHETYARKDELDGYSVGDVRLYHGSIASIPTKWALCDGLVHNGIQTPDYGGLYFAGYKAGDADFGTVGAIIGSNTVALEEGNNAPHFHNSVAKIGRGSAGTLMDSADNSILSTEATGDVQDDDNNAYKLYGSPAGYLPTTGKSSVSGLGTPHENKPRTVVLAIIMKVA